MNLKCIYQVCPISLKMKNVIKKFSKPEKSALEQMKASVQNCIVIVAPLPLS